MNKHHFLIVHGTRGSPEGNWFPWLKQQLEKRGHTVDVPAFPTPQNQSFESWNKIAAAALKKNDPRRTILIGHSTGAGFVLRLAETAKTPFRAVFSICPFIEDLGIDEYDALNATFVHHDFQWAKVRDGADEFRLFAGDNDPYVPLACSEKVALHLQSDLTVVRNGGHLNAEFNYQRFDALLDALQTIV